ncbi:MAG TPA: bifunctional oligoribonuclease/PAP phosphatase NrnA [Ktedonobacteraceae bacterium]|nr:bifunctional oligoribonuclease/PAP phosphatase NrnA [Ktedonobacteraceae bacterium]
MSVTSLQTDLTQQLDPVLVEQALALIEPSQRIALLAHERPDGDCLGSALGMAHMLRLAGKHCVPVCSDVPSKDWNFMPGIETLQTTLGDENFDLVIALDAGELSRYGAVAEQHSTFLAHVPILNIDHHISSHGCGLVNIIEPGAAATAEILVLFQQQARLPLNTDAAQCLLTGLITDTASFQYPSTSSRTMEAGALLLRAGAVAETIVKPIFRTLPLAKARFQAIVIKSARTVSDGRVIWSYATDETLVQAGADTNVDDNCASMLRDIEGVKIAAFFKNYGDATQTRLSLRSEDPYDVAAICMRHGGGGHPRAAGATLPMPLEEAMAVIVQELEAEMNRE